AHLHRDLHAGAGLIDGRRRPTRPQRGDDVLEGVERLVSALRNRHGRRQGDRERRADAGSGGGAGWARLKAPHAVRGRALLNNPPRHLASAATCTRVIRSGSTTGSPFLILSTTSMPERTSPTTVYLPLRKAPSAYMMKNCEFAEFGSFARAIPTMPRL